MKTDAMNSRDMTSTGTGPLSTHKWHKPAHYNCMCSIIQQST